MSKVLFYENVGHSPAWEFVPDALNELDEIGFGFRPRQSPVWNDAVLVAFSDDGDVAGFIIYRPDDPKKSWFIMLAYTRPLSRREGVHSELFRSLVERAKLRNILCVESGTHINNVPAQKSFESQGRCKVAVMYEYRISDFVEGTPFNETND